MGINGSLGNPANGFYRILRRIVGGITARSLSIFTALFIRI